MISVNTTSASSFAKKSLGGASLNKILKYVNNIHNFILSQSIVLISFIYILDLEEVGRTPTRGSPTRNSRGVGGILC
jgi:hypothetical protein